MDRDRLTRTLFKGGAILFLGLVFDLGISFFAKLFIARYLGRVDYGSISLGVTIISVGSTVLLLGTNTGIGRYLPRYDDPNERRAIMATGAVLTLPLALVVGALIALNSTWVAETVFRAPESGPVLAVFGIGLPFAVFYQYAHGVIQGHQWAVPKTILQNVLEPLTRFLLIAVGLAIGASAVEMAYAYVIPFVVISTASLYWLRRTDLFTRSVPLARDASLDVASTLVRFSLPLIVTTLMLNLLADIDRFLLSYFQSTGDVGVYSVVYPIARLFTVGLSAFSFIFMPMLSELHADSELGEMKRIYQVASRWIFFLTLPIAGVLLLFPAEFISLTFGREYVPGAAALVVLGAGFLVHTVVGLNGSALTSIGHTRFLAITNVVVVAVNIGANLLLIPQFSYLGAAVATAVSYFGMNVAYSVRLYQVTGIQPFSAALLRPGLPAIALLVVVGASLRLFIPLTPLWIVLHVGVFAIGYATILLIFGAVQEEEKQIVSDIGDRLGVDFSGFGQ